MKPLASLLALLVIAPASALPIPWEFVPVSTQGTNEFLAADLDGDGDNDIVEIRSGELRWRRSLFIETGTVAFDPAVQILAHSTEDVRAGDANGDGDIDLFVIRTDGVNFADVWWIENLGGSPPVFVDHRISEIPTDFTFLFFDVGDVEQDGDLDIVVGRDSFANHTLFLNDGSGSFSFGSFVPAATGVREGLFLDADGDGDLDVASRGGTVFVTLNDGAGMWTALPPLTNVTGIAEFDVGDADGDGDDDVFVSDEGFITLYPGPPGSEPPVGIAEAAPASVPLCIEVADLSCDGRADVLAALCSVYVPGNAFWFRSVDDNAWPLISFSTGLALRRFAVADMNNDGLPDLLLETFSDAPFDTRGNIHRVWVALNRGEVINVTLGAVYDTVGFALDAALGGDLIKATGAKFNVDEEIEITPKLSGVTLESTQDIHRPSDAFTTFSGSATLVTADGFDFYSLGPVSVDAPEVTIESPFQVVALGSVYLGPGPSTLRLETPFARIGSELSIPGSSVVFASGDLAIRDVPRFSEPQGFPRGGEQRPLAGAYDTTAADLDGDGLVEILAAGAIANRVVWYDNRFGAMTERVITDSRLSPRAIATGDLDGDGDIDVATASFDDVIAWHENDGQDPPSFTEHIVFEGADGAIDIVAADIDLDGDIDLAAVSRNDDTLRWFESDGLGNPTFLTHTVATHLDGALALDVGDLDGIGGLDFAVVSALDGRVRAFLQDGAGAFSEMGFDPAPDPRDVLIADVDGSGAADIVFTSGGEIGVEIDPAAGARGARIVLERPRGGRGSTGSLLSSLAVGDLDNDDDLDLVVTDQAADDVFWVENDIFGFMFREIEDNPDGPSHPRGAHIADFDGDLVPDIIACSEFGFGQGPGRVLPYRQLFGVKAIHGGIARDDFQAVFECDIAYPAWITGNVGNGFETLRLRSSVDIEGAQLFANETRNTGRLRVSGTFPSQAGSLVNDGILELRGPFQAFGALESSGEIVAPSFAGGEEEFAVTVSVSEGPAAGEWSGSLLVDTQGLAGDGVETLLLSTSGGSFDLAFNGASYTEQDDDEYPSYPRVTFVDGQLQGIDFLFTDSTPGAPVSRIRILNSTFSYTAGGQGFSGTTSYAPSVAPTLTAGSFSLAEGSRMLMLRPGVMVEAAGSFDALIRETDDFDLADDTLALYAFGAASRGAGNTLEAMSLDRGASDEGFDRSLPHSFPIGTLVIGPPFQTKGGGDALDLVDAHQNADGTGPEAIYCDTLELRNGVQLSTNGLKIYYRELVGLDGTVDDMGNLVQIAGAGVTCDGDATGDDAVDFADLNAVLVAFGNTLSRGERSPADLDESGAIDFTDLSIVLQTFGQSCAP